MATVRERSNGTFEYRFTRKGLLAKPLYYTFDTRAEGDAFAARVEGLLDRGVVPEEVVQGATVTLGGLLRQYEVTPLSRSDIELVPTLCADVSKVPVAALNYAWVEAWVVRMKGIPLAPSTLVKRVGLLARCVDWALRMEKVTLPNNPLRLLPRGYASKGVAREKAWVGERDRRLEPTEEGAIRKVLIKKEEHLLFDMALESGMRLREMYTLTVGQIDLRRATIFLDKTKNGDKRQVPVTSVLKEKLGTYLAGREDVESLIFPWWNGVNTPKELRACTTRLSQQWALRFAKAGCPDFHFHDTRHEATARFFERTTLTDLEISKITGHKDPRMLRRYANLRASGLAAKLW